jgi:hypothetical protein
VNGTASSERRVRTASKPKIQTMKLSPDETRAEFRQRFPGLLAANKCPNFIEHER